MSSRQAETTAAERRGAVAVPADRRVRVPVQLPHRRARRARRRDRLAVRPALRLAERLRQPARPGGRVLPLRAVRHQPSRPRAHYEPGTNVLVTTWKTPSGWVVVRDALTMGPREHEDDDHAAHAAAGRRRRRAPARAHGRVPRGLASRSSSSASRSSTTAEQPAEWTLVDGRSPRRRRDRRRRRRCARTRISRSASRATACGRATCSSRATGLLRAVVGRGARGSGDVDDADARIAATVALLAALAGPRAHPRSPLARPDPALGARDQGPDVHADRRDGRRAHDVAAGDAGRRAQLGLPLHLDARHDVHAPGAPLPEPRLGGRRVHAVRRRHRAERGRRAADHVRDRRAAGPRPSRRSTTCPATPARGRCGSATAPSTSARTTCSAPCSTRSCSTRAGASGCRGGCGRSCRRRPSARRRCGRTPTRASGRRAARRSTTCRRSSCAGSRSTARRSWPRSAATRSCRRRGRATAEEIRADILEHGVERPRRPPSALRDRRARRLDAAGGDLRVPPGRRRAPARHRARDRGRAHRGRLRPALPDGGDRRRPLRRGGHVPHLLVLARVGARDRRRAAARARPHGAAAPRRVAARALRRGVRRQDRSPPRQLPAGVLAPRADRGGGANHPRRATRGSTEPWSSEDAWTPTT